MEPNISKAKPRGRLLNELCKPGIRNGLLNADDQRYAKVLDAMRRIMEISHGAAVLCAARLGKSAFANMKKEQISSLIRMIEEKPSLFASPFLEGIFNNFKFQRLNASLPSSDPSEPQLLELTTHIAATKSHDRIYVQCAQDLGSSGPETSAKMQGCPDSIFLLCVGTPAVEDIGKSDLLGVPVNLSDIDVFNDGLGAIFQREEISGMQRDLGKAFIRRVRGEPVIHQTIVSMLFARAKDQVEAEFKRWDWLISQIQNNSLLEYITNKEASNVLILLANTNSDWEEISVPDLYSHLQILSAFHGSLSICPSETETQWAGCKIGDIRILDMIAQDADWKYSYRPRTCFGMGRCILPSTAVKKMVIKRGYSCGAGHVEVVDGTQRHNLRCIDTEQSHSEPYNIKIDIREPIFFHQEYIESLQTFGEYRVYISRGKILAIAHTNFDWGSKTKHFAVKRALPKDFAWFSSDHEKQQQKLKELEDFALFEYSRLLDRCDIMEKYRSIRVGVRLDIGVSELSRHGRPFVSEITRFPMADQLPSLILDQPYLTISQEWAESMIEEYTRYL
ncbi:hypothetical protein BKA60DRAFT_665046 [Fusarium oxysporum]|nr:hypothetical protein BKA60DRAFT_665046 [Fusarium oxysporum]